LPFSQEKFQRRPSIPNDPIDLSFCQALHCSPHFLYIDSIDMLLLIQTELSKSRNLRSNVSLGDFSHSHALDNITGLIFGQFEDAEAVFFDLI